MDEQSFQEALEEVNLLPCPFEKVILGQRAYCQLSLRHMLADREHAGCQRADGRQQCQQLLRLLQKNARFALGTSRPSGPLPHNKALRLQTGGLIGLQLALHPETKTDQAIADIHTLLQQAIAEFESLEELPYFDILRSITTFRRKKREIKRQ